MTCDVSNWRKTKSVSVISYNPGLFSLFLVTCLRSISWAIWVNRMSSYAKLTQTTVADTLVGGVKCWRTAFAEAIACDTSPQNDHVFIFSKMIVFLSKVIQLLTAPITSHDSFNRLPFKMPSYDFIYCTAVSFCFDCVVTNNLPLCQFCCIAGNQFFIIKFGIRFSCFQKILEEYPTSTRRFEIVSEKTIIHPTKNCMYSPTNYIKRNFCSELTWSSSLHAGFTYSSA